MSQKKKLEGRVAVVTGASKGIGAGIAKELAAQGAAVVVNYVAGKDAADRVVASIVAADGRAIAVAADVSKPADIEALFVAAKKEFGKVDILVNNAGRYGFTPLETLTAEVINGYFALNVTGALLVTKAAVPLFPPEGGSIINIGSVIGHIAPAASSVYAGTKGAMWSITRALASELAPKKIRVNSIHPGATETEGFHAVGFAGSDFEKAMVAQTPLGRLGQPDDIAGVVAFLASDDARWMTGTNFEVAGGWR